MTPRTLLPAALFCSLLAASCQNTEKQSAAPVDFDPEAAMQEMMEVGQPGQYHEYLKPMAGMFRAKVTMWETPDAEPQTSTGTMTNRWICDGRFLQGDFAGEFNDMTFTGNSLTGYDPYRECYVGTWVDSVTTMFPPQSTGQASNGGKTIEMSHTHWDPMRKIDVTSRQVIEIVDNNRHNFTMYMSGPGLDEYKAMTIEYTRM